MTTTTYEDDDDDNDSYHNNNPTCLPQDESHVEKIGKTAAEQVNPYIQKTEQAKLAIFEAFRDAFT